MMHMGVPPNQTIYVNNLNEKTKKDELKKALYAVFSQFGKIMDIVCMKTLKLRGQAWIVFEDVTASTNALRQMQGFPFYDKPMRISYAKSKSHAVERLDGTFELRQRKKVEEKEKLNSRKRQETRVIHERAAAAPTPRQSFTPAYPAPPQMLVVPPPPYIQASRVPVQEPPAPPNNILFVQNLPHEASGLMITHLFKDFPGFKEVRMVEAKPGIAFVEFEGEMQATVAMSGLKNFKITPTNPMKITYAKK